MGSTTVWPAYLEAVSGTTNRKAIADAMSAKAPEKVAASTITKWFTGQHKPTNAAHVALFALAYDRNPLEAFVAAGLLDAEDAAKGLTEESVILLASLSGRSNVGQTTRSRTTGFPKPRR